MKFVDFNLENSFWGGIPYRKWAGHAKSRLSYQKWVGPTNESVSDTVLIMVRYIWICEASRSLTLMVPWRIKAKWSEVKSVTNYKRKSKKNTSSPKNETFIFLQKNMFSHQKFGHFDKSKKQVLCRWVSHTNQDNQGWYWSRIEAEEAFSFFWQKNSFSPQN